LQYAFGAHCASLVQIVPQLEFEPVQRYGAQLGLPGLPAGTTVHCPSAVRSLHVSQAPEHALLQQNPSTQNPVAHSRQPATRQSVVRLHD
jgi:hypothetical protein